MSHTSHKVNIESARVLLRAATIDDAKDLFECFKDGEVMRYWDSPPHQTLEETQRWVRKMLDGEGNGITDFVLCLKTPDTTPTAASQHEMVESPLITSTPSARLVHTRELKVIGKAGVWRDNEIGFLLNREYWGKGLAWEGLQLLIDHLFSVNIGKHVPNKPNTTNDNQCVRQDIVADVDPRNAASLGLLKKLGFDVYDTKEKTFKVGDEWVDSVYLSLKRDAWLQRRAIEMEASRLGS